MKPDEAIDVGRAAGTTLRALTKVIRGVHFAVTDTVHDALKTTLGPIALPVKAIQDTVTAGTYAVTGFGLDAGARIAGRVTAYRMGRHDSERLSIHDGPNAHYALAASLGVRGDHLADLAPTIVPALQIRAHGARVEPTSEALATAYPEATGTIVVFLHGLCQTEEGWRLGAKGRPTYAERLATDLGVTSVLVRYNSGLRVSDNGAALGALLEELVAEWPVPVKNIVLVGYSMGGLVVHSALAEAAVSDVPAPWLALVSDTITIGTPHHGAPMARGASRSAQRWALTRGQWVSDFLGLRSVGIRDLDHGNLVRADWEGARPDDQSDRRTHPEPPPGHDHIRHHAIVGVLHGRLSERVGDLIVPGHSAGHADTDASRSRYGNDRLAVVHGMTHISLLTSDEVHGHLHRWVSQSGHSSLWR